MVNKVEDDTELSEAERDSGKFFAIWESSKNWLGSVLPLVLFAVVAWLLYREFGSIKAADVVASFRTMRPSAIVAAVLLTICNYVVMIGYDWIGVRIVHHKLSFRQVAIVSLLYYSLSNSLGAVFGGAPVRIRLYSTWGMSASQIVRMLFFIGLAFWMGLFLLGGSLFVVAPFDIPAKLSLPFATSRPLGVVMLVAVLAFLAVCAVRTEPLHLFKINFQPPPLRVALAMTLIAAVDFLLASSTLYVLLPEDSGVNFLSFTAIVILAIIAALASHVPGGLGVLELVLVTMLPDPSHHLIGSLIAFRVIYYFLPLILAVNAIGYATLRQYGSHAKQVAKRAVRWNQLVAPHVITASVFASGLILLASGSLPTATGRMEVLRRVLPLPVIEVSHFLGSLAGAMLLILARGLQRRIDAAWWMTMGMLAVGALLSLTKGFDYEEAIILSLLLIGMIPCRSYFYRRGKLFTPSLSVAWISSVSVVIILLVGTLMFSFKHVEYSHSLWWDFAYHGDAPRSMRALLGASVLLLLVGVARMLRPHADPPPIATASELDEVASIVNQCPQTNANLALLGDKRFVFSSDRKAFVMFGCEGGSWIAMGDPVGLASSVDDAAWQFCEACDAAGVTPVFYQVMDSTLGRYIEMGMSMIKLGELARVPLKDFSLEGSSRKDLRRTKRKAEEAGLRFEIVESSKTAALMPELREISDLWLGDKSAGEKGFSLGYFDEDYLSRFDLAIIRKDNEAIAFANIWRGYEKSELSIDLMRYKPDVMHGVMEYLFIELMLYGHQQGYQWFDMGMAPLSGTSSHRLSSLWSRISGFTFRHGERFYNFQGLRAYKSKFDPEWSPRYLACPPGFAMARSLVDVTTLIAGGLSKLIGRNK